MKPRKFQSKKKLGSIRIDLSIAKKKEYIRRICVLKQPYKEVRKIYLQEFKKDLPRSTFNNWKKEASLLDPGYTGVNCRAHRKRDQTQENFEVDVMRACDESLTEIDGIAGLNLECIKLQKSKKYDNEAIIQNLQFSQNYLRKNRIKN